MVAKQNLIILQISSKKERSNEMQEQSLLIQEPHNPAPYEAPRIETVLTPEELEREVLYAGNSVS
jgi:hypothetical protein